MDSILQPPNKRRHYMILPESPPPPPPVAPEATPPSRSSQTLTRSPTPPPSSEEILAKRRNKDEIRGVFECYKRIRFCLSKKEGSFMSDLEQSYRALISASKGNNRLLWFVNLINMNGFHRIWFTVSILILWWIWLWWNYGNVVNFTKGECCHGIHWGIFLWEACG